MVETNVDEPFPIFKAASKFLLFDIDTITYARREHHILGVLVGNIPQASQQNVFSGIPLELMPEEVRLLVVNGYAFIVDDVAAHSRNLDDLVQEDRDRFVANIQKQGMEAARAVRDASLKRKAAWLAKNKSKAGKGKISVTEGDHDSTVDLSGLNQETRKKHHRQHVTGDVLPTFITPTVSYPPLRASRLTMSQAVPVSTERFQLFAYLHARGYFMSPGLRFGCQLMAYPGDPLRYHSHFLAVSKAWNEPIDLLDVVAGGRLGTGVKKGYMLGGTEKIGNEGGIDKGQADPASNVRVFCFEWAAM